MKKIISMCIAMALIALVPVFSVPVSAESETYTIDDGKKIPISSAYLYKYSIDYFTGMDVDGYLNQPEDLYYDSQNNLLYIADTMNNRVICSDTEGKIVKIFTEGGSKSFWQPM